MNPIERFKEQLAHDFPTAVSVISKPASEDGVWWLEVRVGRKHLSIEWSHEAGFGISDVNRAQYGQGADELVDTIEELTSRVAMFLNSTELPSPPLGVLLARLREIAGLTQGDVAKVLGVTQASISGFERRDDIQLSTLKRLVGAMGGNLEMYAVLGDTKYRIAMNEEKLAALSIAPKRFFSSASERTA